MMMDGVNNPRLRNYELELEKHLRNLLSQIEEQLRKQELDQRSIRLLHQRLQHEEPVLKKELKRLWRELDESEGNLKKYEENEENDQRARDTASRRLDELHEELLGEIHREKELRAHLNNINHQIHTAQLRYDSERGDIKTKSESGGKRVEPRLMKNMVGKAKSDVATMEKDKRIQDAYIDRLRKDIEIGEAELEQLLVTAKRLKESQATERGEFNRLKEQLETFKAGTLNMEDHFAKLMKSLQHNRNKVQLLDKRQTQVRQNEVIAQTTSKSAAIGRRIMRLSGLRDKQEARISKRETANHHLRLAAQKQQLSMPDVDRALCEAETLRDKLRIQAEAAEDEHEMVRNERQFDLHPNDVQAISEAYEQIEKQLFLNEFKLNAYKKVGEELDELVKERKASDKLAPPKSLLELLGVEGRSRSAENGWRSEKNYSKMRDSMTELTRKKVALEYKRKRMEEKIQEKKQLLRVSQQKVEALLRLQNELEKKHEEKVESTLPVVVNAQVDEREDPERLMEQKIADYTSRLRSLETETRNMQEVFEKTREDCEYYCSKIGDFEALENIAEKHVQSLNEIHQLQKSHQLLEKELWQIQKELEYTVMVVCNDCSAVYRYFREETMHITGHERSWVPTMIRVQRQQNNDKLREEIFKLEQDINQTASFLSIN